MFDIFMTDSIVIKKESWENILETKVSFQEPKVHMNKIYTEIEEGYVLERTIEGKVFQYVITEVKHNTGGLSIPGYTLLKVAKNSPKTSQNKVGNTYNIGTVVNHGNFSAENNGIQKIEVNQGAQIDKIIELLRKSDNPKKNEIIATAEEYKLSPTMELFWKLVGVCADAGTTAQILYFVYETLLKHS